MMRLISRLSVLALLIALPSCNGAEKPTAPLPTVAVATLMSHPALDEVRAGVVEGLAGNGLVEGRDYRLVERNANGQTPVAATIAGELAAQRPAVIVAIATPMAQAVKARWQGPLVFAAVTDPVGAGLVRNLKGSPNVTGVSDAWPYREQLQLIREIQPGARRLGVLFNPGEAASQYGMIQIRALAPTMGFTIVEAPVSATAEVAIAARLVAGKSDALFLSSDNTVISAVGAAYQEAVRQKKPLYVGDSGTVERGGLAAVSVGYRSVGLETGKLAARMLRGERNLAVIVARGSDIYVNRKAAADMGVTVPDTVTRRAVQVFDAVRR